jgi:hypothetical protein
VIFKPIQLHPSVSMSIEDRHTAILAASRHGKSYLTGVVAEEIAGSAIPVSIFDPEGEYYTLGEHFPVIIVGHDVPLVKEGALLYAELCLKYRYNLIFDFSSLDTDIDVQEMYTPIGNAFQSYAKQHQRVNAALIFDECHVFAPQGKEPDSLKSCRFFSQRGAKRGLSTLWASQRPASVNKNVLSQCGTWLLGKFKSIQDLEQIKHHIPDGFDLSQFLTMPKGQWLLCGDERPSLFHTRKRLCAHGGGQESIGLTKATIKRKLTVELMATIDGVNLELGRLIAHKKQEEREIERLIRENAECRAALEKEKRDHAKTRERLLIQDMVVPLVKRQVAHEIKAQRVSY